VPVAFFSLFKGKHHHYMLGCLAPAAAIAAYGANWMWLRAQTSPNWQRRPWFWLATVGLPAAVAIYLFRHKLPGPNWIVWVASIGWMFVVLCAWWSITRREGRGAMIGFCTVVVVVHCATFEYRTRCADDYGDDLNLMRLVDTTATADRPVLVLGEMEPLNPSWPLFYLNGPSTNAPQRNLLTRRSPDVA